MTITYMTRAKSWNEVKETLSTRQHQVLEALTVMEKGTSASELAMQMWDNNIFITPDRNNVHPRLNELVALGFVYVTGKRACSLTGKTVAVYKSVIT